jgi:DHA1 family bicyclomycin/chloramphenicol resistance-like MFS transporter
MSQMNHVLLKRFTSQKLVRNTLMFQTVFGILLLIGTTLDWFNLYTYVVMVLIFLAGQGLSGPNSTALSLAPFTRLSGSAASLLGSYRMAVGGLATALVSWFHNGTAVPMTTVMIGCPTAGLIILAIGKSAVRYHARRKQVEDEPSVLL